MNAAQDPSAPSDRVVYRNVPIREDSRQRALAYLHIVGMPRNRPSGTLRVYLGPCESGATGKAGEPGREAQYVAEHTTYTSPTPFGAAQPAHRGEALAEDQEPAEEIVDISNMGTVLQACAHIDVSFEFLEQDKAPSTPPSTPGMDLKAIFITTRPAD